MKNYRVMLPDQFLDVMAGTEQEALEIAWRDIRDTLSTDDLIVWESDKTAPTVDEQR